MPNTSVLRDRGRERVAHVTNMELFFDLVYVFAITQLSEYLYDDPSFTGGLETAVLFLAVWWAWNYTAWATNWIDPERRPVVGLMAVTMILGLIMASAIPEAFGHRGLAFAAAYVSAQVVRAGFMVWAFGSGQKMRRNYAQLLAWSLIAGVVWVVGALVPNPDARLAIWTGAVVLDLMAPMIGFWLPGVASTPMDDWTLAGGHLAERCQLVLMIAFGESVLRIGGSFAQAPGRIGVDAAFIVGFILTFALWSIYFLHHASHGAERMESDNREAARLGRAAYAYAHAVMVGAVIVLAVAIHFAVSDPGAGVDGSFAVLCLGGPALFLIGITMSKRSLDRGRLSPPLLGVAALVVFGALASLSTRLCELGVAAVIAVALAIAAQLEPEPQRAGPESPVAAGTADLS